MTSPPSVEQARERLDRLYRDHAPAVYRCARTRLAPHDAEDVVCEVFTVAWRRIDVVPEHELGWLLRTTRHVMSNHVRAGLRRRALAVRVATTQDHDVQDASGDVVALDTVDRVLAGLPSRDQEVLRLLVVEDLSIPELAAALGCRPNTASVRVRRAKERLARVYAERQGAATSTRPQRGGAAQAGSGTSVPTQESKGATAPRSQAGGFARTREQGMTA
ncbi:RNA polymerase sigma factor [Luteimicrobium subarcticum]|uniref:RNA polymerase sigma-70 factor (ECF subfamily) n=1 Tax=Luteimicrobium subarcticum TaxID=620910 RepID=A0A2M8W1K3_9MICO|nr:sigma-70 family RNA polymerase sigma factor [Luteimicrobium subarcticum]PJI84807.1 RNA polymerase sigma-70 factor (ECF subfamily) [Luteimicrobium subarcticum]